MQKCRYWLEKGYCPYNQTVTSLFEFSAPSPTSTKKSATKIIPKNIRLKCASISTQKDAASMEKGVSISTTSPKIRSKTVERLEATPKTQILKLKNFSWWILASIWPFWLITGRWNWSEPWALISWSGIWYQYWRSSSRLMQLVRYS